MEIVENFSRTCKTLTTVYAFKYQLQHYLFHDDNKATTKVLQNLTSIVIGLEAMASYLQEIATNHVSNYICCTCITPLTMMSLQGTVCIQFSPKQYMKLYECNLLYVDDSQLTTDAKVLTSMVYNVFKKWFIFGGFEKTISGITGTPTHNCITK